MTTRTALEVADDPVFAGLAEAAPSASVERFAPVTGPVQDVVLVDREHYHAAVAALKEAGFDTFADLCAVDYLRRRPRFEVVTVLTSISLRRRIRVRVGVPGDDTTVASITDLFAGANFFEREAYDLMGVVFEGHPDLTRILMPDDWEGHPLRKDYAVGSVPVQFKGSHKTT
jgi:NADH-quinone oxidoreductase subunit C